MDRLREFLPVLTKIPVTSDGSMNQLMPGPLLYVYTILMAVERCSIVTAPGTFIFWTEKQEMFLTLIRSVKVLSKHLLLYTKAIWL